MDEEMSHREVPRSQEETIQQQQQQQQLNQQRAAPVDDLARQALGLEALHKLCNEIYPDQKNPLTVTTVVKFWLGGPDPLDYISMFENPGDEALGVPPHWHYVSMGLSDLHGDGRLHPDNPPGNPSGFGFELTFRLRRQPGDKAPPTWPANIMQHLAKYVFTTNNLLLPGDHVSWHSALDGTSDKIRHILMARDPQFPEVNDTVHGELQFVQIVGVTQEELKAAQYWNGLGVLDLLKTSRNIGPWLITDMKRPRSIMEEDPSVGEQVQRGIERDGSNLSGVSAHCCWDQMTDFNGSGYRSFREPPIEEDDEDEDIKPDIKMERLSPTLDCEILPDVGRPTPWTGVHLKFDVEAGTLLPFAIKGRIMHGRHFTFKSIISNGAVTFVPPNVTGKMVSAEKPYVLHGPWLQVLLPDNLVQKMYSDLQELSAPGQVPLPKTYFYLDHKMAITIANRIERNFLS